MNQAPNLLILIDSIGSERLKKWSSKNARNFGENFQNGNQVFSSKKVKILLSMNTVGEFKVIGGLWTQTDGFTNGRKNSLPVPTLGRS